MRRVVVTGLGVVSSIGNNAAEVLASLKAGKSGITFNEDMAEHGFRSQIAGAVDLNVADHVDKRTLRFMGPGAAYAYIAMWAAASYVITALTVRLVEVPSALALSSLGGVAAAIYYWFAALILATTFSLGPVGATGLRISTLALVGFWWWRTRASELWP